MSDKTTDLQHIAAMIEESERAIELANNELDCEYHKGRVEGLQIALQIAQKSEAA